MEKKFRSLFGCSNNDNNNRNMKEKKKQTMEITKKSYRNLRKNPERTVLHKKEQ